KKYANRRLYNTAKSSYVTLDHLAAMVREGEDFVVYDAKSGDDITRSVLTQIIFEEEAKGHNMLPISFLRQIIGLYGDTLQGYVPGYLEASMEAFSRNQGKLREQVSAAFGKNPALSKFETVARSNMELFENAMRMFTPFSGMPGMPGAPKAEGDGEGAAAKPAAGAEPTPTPKPEPEFDALKTQLAEMQAQLNKLTRGNG
ncbi:MAG: polyhydroxyalkanoate synthesis repressor PhaR, partial [Paracoccaceae bacterium]